MTGSLRSLLEERARRGFQGYPLATVAFYGPDDKTATKVTVGIVTREDAGPAFLERWFNSESDVRLDAAITSQIITFIERYRVQSVVLGQGIIGCPHEEGVDYPEDDVCPHCPFWARRDRWTVDPRD
jgi:hypothetical protein